MKHPSLKQPGFMGENPNHDYRMVGNHEKKHHEQLDST